MIYSYLCNDCDTKQDVIKPVRDYDKIEHCKVCSAVMTREFAPQKIHLFGTSVQERVWNPAIGKPVTDREMRQIAKERGWIETGNERIEKHVHAPEIEYPTFSDDDIKSLTRNS